MKIVFINVLHVKILSLLIKNIIALNVIIPFFVVKNVHHQIIYICNYMNALKLYK